MFPYYVGLAGMLTDTNWRTINDGVSHRLGILAGRLRVYEHEEDIPKTIPCKIEL